MSEVKTLRVSGEIRGGFRTLRFTKDVRALSEKEAIEKVYNEVAAKHKLKRYHVKITKIEPINPESSKNPLIVKIASIGESR